MSRQDYEVNYHLRARDTATPVVDAGTKKILQNYKVLRQEQRSVRAEFELNHRTLVDTANAFRAVGNIASNLTNIYTKYNIMQLRVSDANRRLREAQSDYNRILVENGPGTEEAIRASRELDDAKREATQAQQEQTLGMIGFVFELGTSISLIVSAIPKIRELGNSFRRATTLARGLQAATVAAGVTTVASTGAAGAATGTTAITGKVGRIGAGGALGAAGIFAAVFGQTILDNILAALGDTQAAAREQQRVLEGQAFQDFISGKSSNVGITETGRLVDINARGNESLVIIKIINGTEQVVTADKGTGNVEVFVSDE